MTLIVSSILSYLLKALPFYMKGLRFKENSFLYKTFEYAVYFIMGNIIINISLDNISLTQLYQINNGKLLATLLTLITSFVISKITGNILVSLIISSLFYLAASWSFT